jgi:hypothetical protein
VSLNPFAIDTFAVHCWAQEIASEPNEKAADYNDISTTKYLTDLPKIPKKRKLSKCVRKKEQKRQEAKIQPQPKKVTSKKHSKAWKKRHRWQIAKLIERVHFNSSPSEKK